MLHADLSARQCRLVELAATGLPGPELASLFELSHKRVRQCLIDLYRVTGAEGRMDLAWWHWQTQGRAALTDEARTDARSLLTITIHEGRNRIVRRMMDSVGHPVDRLARVAIGPVRLGSLPVGQTRDLSRDELGALLDLLKL